MPEVLPLHRIVIVGGGAGGLELATALGNTLGKKQKAHITLVDCTQTHVWKPLLHEIAAGSMSPEHHALNYLAQAYWHHFHFRLGRMQGINRSEKLIYLAPQYDDDSGQEITAAQAIAYDTLVIAVGSTTHDFGITGVQEFATALDTPQQAERFHRKLLNTLLRAQSVPIETGQLDVVIVGAGATGVELAAELHQTTRELTAYGFDNISAEHDIRISLIEAGECILPALPTRLSNTVVDQLHALHIHLYTRERVIEVNAQGVRTHSGLFIPSRLVVWSAGIKAPDFLAQLDGLEVNTLNQLVVLPTLQTSRDANIFAFGDCCACPWLGHQDEANRPVNVPPRAQAAHQQAKFLAQSLKRHMAGKPLPNYRYRDYGSLINLGNYSAVGSLMGSISAGRLHIEGILARLVYQALYQQHLIALHGMTSVVLQLIARLITRRIEPRVKLH